MRKNVYDINYDLPYDADMQIFTALLYNSVIGMSRQTLWKSLIRTTCRFQIIFRNENETKLVELVKVKNRK